MKKIIVLFLLMVLGVSSAKAQQEDYAKFTISKAVVDGYNCSEEYRSNNAYLVFYNSEGNEFCMANVWPKSDTQSYGTITGWKSYRYNETETEYASDVFKFKWHYRNSYDDKQGVASCKLIKIYKPSGVVYEFEYILPNGSTAHYSGYMQGTMKF